MDATLLATKLFVPPVAPGLVPRPHLVQRLHGILTSKLTLVSASAGFGKTTLLAQWVQHSSIPVAWLSLEEAENDPARFWEYFIAALQTARPGVGGIALDLLRSPQPPAIESLLTTLINDLASSADDFALVLDDYHAIQSEAVHKGVAFLLDHLPPKMHLVIGTRADPPLALAHFRGRGMLLEIGVDELRFSREETASLLAALGAPALSTGDAEALNTRTEGWVVGLKMAILSMRGHEDIAAFVSGFTGSHRYIMDYLIEEVLQRQLREVRDFLLQTSILERLTGPLCDAVTQSTGGQEALISLERANLFLVPLDSSRGWYRYHQLFRELLLHRLGVEEGDRGVRDLHLRAGRWHEANGSLEEAIHHALKARDWEKAIELISHPRVNVPRLQSLTMLNWLSQIPEELLRSRVPLFLSYVWNLKFAGRYSAAEDRLKYLEKAWEHDSLIQGHIARVRGFMAFDSGDTPAAEAHAKKALSLFGTRGGAALSPGDADRRGSVSMLLGAIYLRRGLFQEADPLLREAIEEMRRAGMPPILPLTGLAVSAGGRGRLHEAANLYHEIIDASKGNPNTAMPHLFLGNVHYEWNELETAASHHEQAVTLYRLSRGLLGFDNAYLNLARTRAALGDGEAAARALENADRVLREVFGDQASPENHARNAAYHAAIALFDGDTESAFRWTDRLAGYEGSIPMDIPFSAHRLLRVRKGKGPLQQRAASYEYATQQGLLVTMIALRIDQALDLIGTDDALVSLSDALTMAKPEGFVRSFVDFGMSLAPLLRQAISRGIESEYARKLLDIIEAEERKRKIRTGGMPASPSAGLLSEREIEVLRLVAEGLSNQQIADRLTVTLSTAKTHVYHIFDKLDAKDRLQAVKRARELKLL